MSEFRWLSILTSREREIAKQREKMPRRNFGHPHERWGAPEFVN